jgi:hypothetical protein
MAYHHSEPCSWNSRSGPELRLLVFWTPLGSIKFPVDTFFLVTLTVMLGKGNVYHEASALLHPLWEWIDLPPVKWSLPTSAVPLSHTLSGLAPADTDQSSAYLPRAFMGRHNKLRSNWEQDQPYAPSPSSRSTYLRSYTHHLTIWRTCHQHHRPSH